MPTLAEQIKTSRDKITRLLTKGSTLSDIGTASVRAWGGDVPFGQALNQIRAGQIAEQQTLMDVLTKERGAKLEEKKFGLAEEKFAFEKQQSVWDMLKAGRDQGVADAKAITDYLDDNVENEASRATIAEILNSYPEKVDATNIHIYGPRAIKESGVEVAKPKELKSADVITLRMPDGPVRGFDPTDPEQTRQMRIALSKGAYEVKLAVEAPGLAEIGVLTDKEKEEAAASSRSASANLARASQLLVKARDLGTGIAGLRRLGAEVAGGVLGQIHAGIGRQVAEIIAGASPAELQRFTTDARALVARMIQPLTGEETGRITEAEREIARQAMALLLVGASFDQVVAGIGVAVKLSVVMQDRFNREADLPLEFDLRTEEGINGMGARLALLGFDTEQVIDTLGLLIAQRVELRRAGMKF